MTTDTIAAGHYILMCDVYNPKPDRRTNGDFELAEFWPKGMRVQVKTQEVVVSHDSGETAHTLYVKSNGSIYPNGRIREHDECNRFKAITAAMEPVNDARSLLQDARDNHIYASEIIEEMYAMGVEEERFRTAIKRIVETRRTEDSVCQESTRGRNGKCIKSS